MMKMFYFVEAWYSLEQYIGLKIVSREYQASTRLSQQVMRNLHLIMFYFIFIFHWCKVLRFL